MPLNRRNVRTMHRRLYAGQLETISLLHRDDDQREGQTRTVVLFQCRRSAIQKQGEPLQGDMAADHQTVWGIPRTELDRTGIDHINNLDIIIDRKGRYWQPEAGDLIEVKLFETRVSVACRRRDPPNAATLAGK